MAQKRPPNYEAHLEYGEIALESQLLDLLSEHNDEGRAIDRINDSLHQDFELRNKK